MAAAGTTPQLSPSDATLPGEAGRATTVADAALAWLQMAASRAHEELQRYVPLQPDGIPCMLREH